LFARNHRVLLQPNAAYRAAVLHEIAKPLIVEEVTAITKLKDLEVSHCCECGYFLAFVM